MTVHPFAKAEMLIRRPVHEVFEAFINPEITTRFWFTKSTGRLEPGKSVQWTWDMYAITVPVKVTGIEQQQQITIEWGNYEQMTTVEFTFTALPNGHTFVSIVNTITEADTTKALAIVRDSTEGFTLVLAGLKALLEHNIILNLVADRFPKGLNG